MNRIRQDLRRGRSSAARTLGTQRNSLSSTAGWAKSGAQRAFIAASGASTADAFRIAKLDVFQSRTTGDAGCWSNLECRDLEVIVH